MKKWLLSANTAFLLLIGIIGVSHLLGIWDLSISNYKVMDRNFRTESLNWEGGIYPWDIARSNYQWETAYVGLRPTEEILLRNFESEIKNTYPKLEKIDFQYEAVQWNGHDIKICVQDYESTIRDTTFLKKLSHQKLICKIEIYHKDHELTVFHPYERQFTYTHSVLIQGYSSATVLRSNLKQIMWSEIIHSLPDVVEDYGVTLANRTSEQSRPNAIPSL